MRQLKVMILQTVEDLRRLSLDLRPSILDDLGLIPALRWLADSMSKESNIKTQIFLRGEERKLAPQTETTIFRVVQEALNNIKRHSKASEANISLEFASDCLKLSIVDNGRGFHLPEKLCSFALKNKLGLIGIQERIGLMGGTFQIHSKPGKGTSLLIELKC